MKTVFTAILMALSLQAFASETIVCTSKKGNKIVTLESVGSAVETTFEDWEYEQPYKITIASKDSIVADYMSLGTAYSADVMFNFFADKKIEGMEVRFYLYWDELDQSGVQIGDARISLDCEAL